MTYHVQFPGLGLEFTLDRVAFTVFGMPIYWYGILIATGLALAIVFAFSHARRFGIDSDRMVDVILIGTVCAVIGGRAFYVATAPFEYASFAEMLDIRLGGVAIYGAVIAAFLSGYFACRWRKVPILPMFDLAIPTALPGVDTRILDPRNTYASPEQWQEKANALAKLFIENFEKYTDTPAGEALVSAGPKL